MHEKNAKPSKVRKQANLERKGDLCEEKLAAIFILPDAGTFADNYFLVSSDGWSSDCF